MLRQLEPIIKNPKPKVRKTIYWVIPIAFFFVNAVSQRILHDSYLGTLACGFCEGKEIGEKLQYFMIGISHHPATFHMPCSGVLWPSRPKVELINWFAAQIDI